MAKSKMNHITDTPPGEIQDELVQLRLALDRSVPAKRVDRNLLVATWNIRFLAGYVAE